MFGFGGGELAIIAGIILLVFGPSQLPRLMRGLGQSVRELRNATREGGEDEEDRKT